MTAKRTFVPNNQLSFW